MVRVLERLGEWLYPRWQPFRRRRAIKLLMVALGVGLLVSGIMTAILFLANSVGQ